MRWLLFLSRLAFICNLFFLLAVSFMLFRWSQNPEIESMVIILGFFMVAFFNPAANACYLVLWLTNKVKLGVVPSWLLVANPLFLLLQIVYIIFFHGR